MNITELLQDIANNAPVDRAGAWLELAAEDNPEIFSALLNNLHKPPQDVIDALATGKYAFAALALSCMSDSHDWIARLQKWFIERGY